MLTPTLFKDLSKKDQCDLLELEGIFLFTRSEADFTIDFYELDDFYVAVWHHNQQEDLIVTNSFYAAAQQPKDVVMHPYQTVAQPYSTATFLSSTLT